MIVAVILLAILALLGLLALGLIGMAIKSSGMLVIDSTTVAIPPKVIFRVEYHPQGRPPTSIEGAQSPPRQKCASEPPGNASTLDVASPESGGEKT